jgi:hypothetical protein
VEGTSIQNRNGVAVADAPPSRTTTVNGTIIVDTIPEQLADLVDEYLAEADLDRATDRPTGRSRRVGQSPLHLARPAA